MARKRRLHPQWFEKGMTETEMAEREATILSSGPTLQILADILRKEKQALDRKYDYDSPAWQYQVALDNGQKKKLDDLLTLLTPIIGELNDRP